MIYPLKESKSRYLALFADTEYSFPVFCFCCLFDLLSNRLFAKPLRFCCSPDTQIIILDVIELLEPSTCLSGVFVCAFLEGPTQYVPLLEFWLLFFRSIHHEAKQYRSLRTYP